MTTPQQPTTTERLYPSVHEPTYGDLSVDWDEEYRLALILGESFPEARAIRVAAHHARRAAELELRLAEIRLAITKLVCAFNDTDSSNRRIARVEQQVLDRAIEAIAASIKDEL